MFAVLHLVCQKIPVLIHDGASPTCYSGDVPGCAPEGRSAIGRSQGYAVTGDSDLGDGKSGK